MTNYSKDSFERQRDNVRQYFDQLGFRKVEIALVTLEDTFDFAVFRAYFPVNLDASELEVFCKDIRDKIAKPVSILRYKEVKSVSSDNRIVFDPV